MNLLLDTHVLLWWLDDNRLLSAKARDAISEGTNPVFISAAVIWEITIKQSLGKLKIPDEFETVLEHQGFEYLDINASHAYATGRLPFFYRDPFDRMLVAQAKVESLTLVTKDAELEKYPVSIMLA